MYFGLNCNTDSSNLYTVKTIFQGAEIQVFKIAHPVDTMINPQAYRLELHSPSDKYAFYPDGYCKIFVSNGLIVNFAAQKSDQSTATPCLQIQWLVYFQGVRADTLPRKSQIVSVFLWGNQSLLNFPTGSSSHLLKKISGVVTCLLYSQQVHRLII